MHLGIRGPVGVVKRGAPHSGLRGSTAKAEAVAVERHPAIQFRERITEGETSALSVVLDEVAGAHSVVSIVLGAGQESASLTVELSAPGFTIEGPRSASMTVKRERDRDTEQVTFLLTANSPGPEPIVRKLIATFWENTTV
jgi:hypothetical protein